jgi:hypothetical protein
MKKKRKRKYWQIHINTKEAAANLYSFLNAFKIERNEKSALKCDPLYLNRWMKIITENVSDLNDYINNDSGPLLDKELTPISIVIKLNSGERFMMLQICQIVLSQLLSEKYRKEWIFNYGESEYELAVTTINTWLNELQSIPKLK